MFSFKPRTLWIIIWITIPLVFVLNQLGELPEEPSATPPSVATSTEIPPEQHWSLDTVTVDCNQYQALCYLPLPGAVDIQLSVISDLLPVSRVEVPQHLSLYVNRQGGKMVLSSDFIRADSLQDTLNFYRDWLPRDGEVEVLVSGDLLPEQLDAVARLATQRRGEGVMNEPSERSALGVLTSPTVGDSAQLAFLLWIDILSQRLAGYELQMRWDHTEALSTVRFNTTLSSDLFYPVTDAELETVLPAYIESANQRERTGRQLHRYAVSARVYQVPFNYYVQQPERLQAITLADVNQAREYSLDQL